jgi:hypothetical protein
MPIQHAPALEANEALSRLVTQIDPLVEEMLPATASALWDLQHEPRPLLILALSDPFGFATGRFAPEELGNRGQVRDRIHDLVAELVYSVRRERLEIRDAFATSEQIANFQLALNGIPNIADKRLRLFNNIRMLPDQPGSFLITDFAVEVDGDVANQVRDAIRSSGFNLRGPPLLERDGVRERVRELVAEHRLDPHQSPRHAVCFNLSDSSDVHLLEVADDLTPNGDGSVEGVGFMAGDTIPGARSIILYLTSPTDLRHALSRNPSHPAVRALRSHDCWFVFPDDEGVSFYRDFPEFDEPGP